MKNKRILILGPDFYDYVDQISNGFATQKNDVCCIKYKYYYGFIGRLRAFFHRIFKRKSKISPTKRELKLLKKKIVETISFFKPDVLLIINGEIFDETFYSSLHCKLKILWMLDLVSRFPECVSFFKSFNHIFFYDKNDCDSFKKAGFNCSFLPDFVDTHYYFPLNLEKDIDVLVIGTLYENRIAVINQITQKFPNLRIKIFGKNFGRFDFFKKAHPSLLNKSNIIVNRNVGPKEANELTNRSKVCLNVQHKDSHYSGNMRFFEALVCNTFQIVNSNSFFEERVCAEFGVFHSWDELYELISFGLAKSSYNDSFQKAIANNDSLDARVSFIVKSIDNLLK